MSKPNIVAGGIVRDREWILPRHIDAVRRCLACVNEEMRNNLVYVTGDNVDRTMDELVRSGAWVANVDVNDAAYERGKYGWHNLGSLRNSWVKIALDLYPEATHIWSVDSDVLPEELALARLVALKKPVVGAWVPCTDPRIGTFMTQWDADNDRPMRGPANDVPRDRPVKATMLGACVLIDADWARNNMPLWGDNKQGEDAYLAKKCRELGVEMWLEPRAKCSHYMWKEDPYKFSYPI